MYKLNAKLILRLAVIFIVLNLFISLVMAIQTFVHLEKEAASIATIIEGVASVDPDDFALLEATGINISIYDIEPEGFNLPKKIFGDSSGMSSKSTRRLELPEIEGKNLFQKLNKLKYHYQFPLNGFTYMVTFDIGSRIQEIKITMSVIMITQMVLLLYSILHGARLIRTTLQPISLLAEAAQSIGKVSSNFTCAKMENLTETLDSINAAKLDTRIPLDETETELKSLADAINCLLDRINDSYQSQIRFVSDASHELRTPISVIEGYANLLDRWGKDDKNVLDEGISAIKGEASNMKGLVEQLLFLARGDNNTMIFQPEHLNLAELAIEVLSESRMIDQSHNYSSNIDDVMICADKGLVKQALRILVDNAIKYTDTGGKILISVMKKDTDAVLIVQDDGIGIPSGEVSQIFDRFYRTDGSRAKITGGSGLGLSIARWVAERHGGHMEVLSRQGIGTKISIIIPITAL